METPINYTNELSLRVYQKIGEQQLRELLLEGKPLMTIDELIHNITDNLGDYLNGEEEDYTLITFTNARMKRLNH